MSDRLSNFIQNEIDQINSHLPAKTISLRIALKMERPGTKTRDGGFIEFEKSEIEIIKDLIPTRYWNHVLLPIIITRRRDLGTGAYRVGGSEANLFIIQQVVDDLPSYEVWKAAKEEDKTFYKPHLQKIRKQFPTTSVLAFS